MAAAKAELEGGLSDMRKAADEKDAALLRRGEELEDRAQDYDGALSEYRQALVLDPSLAEAHAAVGGVLMAVRNDRAGAIVAFRSAVAIDDGLGVAWCNLTGLLALSGDLAAAEAAARQFARLAPDDPDAAANLAQVLEAKGDPG